MTDILLRDLLKMWQKNNRTWTIEFKFTCRPTPVLLNHLHLCCLVMKTHSLCNQCLFYFAWRKCHDLITFFLENKKKIPQLLKISILIEDWDFAIAILSQNQSTTWNHQQHTNFVQGTQCYSLSLKCAYTSSASWIRHWLLTSSSISDLFQEVA